jgi:ectoine hydroxylase-related dioxygenase (phytanoyl-CoA dioxygenase family)
MRKIFTDEALQPGFLESGYVKVPMLSEHAISGLLGAIAELRPDDGFVPSGAVTQYRTYHCSILDTNLDYKRKTDALLRSVFDRHVETVLNGYRIRNCNLYVKPPGTGQFTLHQDWPTIPDLDDTTVTIWCPLGDVVAQNGALQFVVGSHKLLPHVEGPGVPGFFRDFHDSVIEKYLTPIPMKAGEAVIFDEGVIHWSARNGSDRPRIAIAIQCVPGDVPPVYYFMDPARPDRFELIEADTEFWITSDLRALTVRQPHWKRLGFAPNRNRFLTEPEFAALLRQGHDIRRRIYERAP